MPRTWKIYPGDAWHHGNKTTLSALARDLTSLSGPEMEWLHSLVSDWQLLADLSFADLVLWVPRSGALDPSSDRVGAWLAIAQMRPTTGPTAYPADLVGAVVRTGRRGLIDVAWRERRIV